ncbi:MAG: hypothetical protein COA38_17240 [Fluviicola sp.]|nr:MAG: hypothetical protein COA38_17240 [Fluviicola sp.]
MSNLSSEHLNLLPNPIDLQRICKSISAIEAIICPEWQYRYYSYQKDWSESEEVCEMRNGQGDQMLILFSPQGVCINGFAKESKMNSRKNVRIEEKKSFIKKIFGSKKESENEVNQDMSNGVLDNVPEAFNGFVFDEPIKSIGTTFCIWMTPTDANWQAGKVQLPKDDFQDGSKDLLKLLDGNPLTYKKWAQEYYECVELNLDLLERVYAGQSISKELALQINPNLENFDKLRDDLNEIPFEHQL